MSNYKCKNCGREISKYDHDYRDGICLGGMRKYAERKNSDI